ncbi:histidine kinase [uncultured Plantibacter sp.]|uniref:sensor histidine kinase n=1 Tax=uncultured Plantibacter sp. TaxID=293337 RepID=UPI0028D23F8F|nr:histidine kinase [uncultured Plantibacter sp.]
MADGRPHGRATSLPIPAPAGRGRLPWPLRLGILLAAALVCVLSVVFGVVQPGIADGNGLPWLVGHLAALVAAGLIWWLAPTAAPGWVIVGYALAETAYMWAYGVHAGWLWPLLMSISVLPGVALVWLALAFPAGRLRRGFDRRLVITASVYLVTYAIVTLLVTPNHVLDASHERSRYAVLATGDVADALGRVHAGVMGAFAVVVAGVVLLRWARSSGAARQVAFIMPVAFVLWLVIGVAWSLVRLGGWPEHLRLVVEDLNAFSVVLVPAAYATGLIRMRTIRARAVDLVQTGQLSETGHDRWDGAVKTVLGDRTARLVWPGSQRTTDRDPRGRAMSSVGDADAPLVYIEHDAALLDNPQLLRSVSASLRIMIDNERLTAELRHSLREVSRSRLRIVQAADEARRRAERDLHDGSQQQLFSVALRLRMASDAARADGQLVLADGLETTIDQLASAIKELRELARGLHPALLAEGGLVPAIAELGRRCTVVTKVTVELRERPRQLIEATVYYVVSECLANVTKYSGASSCEVVVSDHPDGGLRVVVADDGVGGADPARGSGLRGLADRVDAVGGTMRVESPVGAGTVVSIHLPG